MEGTYNGYLGIFLALLLSTTVAPVPEELPVITAGVMCGHSDTKYAGERDHPARLVWWVMLHDDYGWTLEQIRAWVRGALARLILG